MNYAEMVDEGFKYDDAQTLAIRDATGKYESAGKPNTL